MEAFNYIFYPKYPLIIPTYRGGPTEFGNKNNQTQPFETAPVHQSSSIWTHARHQAPHVGSDVVEVCAEILQDRQYPLVI